MTTMLFVLLAKSWSFVRIRLTLARVTAIIDVADVVIGVSGTVILSTVVVMVVSSAVIVIIVIS